MTIHRRKQQPNTNLKHRPSPHSTQHPVNHARQWLLTGVSMGIIILFFSIPYYRTWLNDRIFLYYRQFPVQSSRMDIEQRMIERHEYDYLIPQFIHQQIREHNVVLLPPQSYIKRTFKPGNYRWANIVWNYYFFGKQPLVQFQSAQPEQLRAVTHAVICEPERVRMIMIETPGQLQQLLASYKTDSEPVSVATVE
jgi:hypothetical protein